MRRLQLGTSLEGPSQLTPTSPCHGHLLPEEEEEEEDEDLGNGEEESCKSMISSTDGFKKASLLCTRDEQNHSSVLKQKKISKKLVKNKK